jgi:hypothetical protein
MTATKRLRHKNQFQVRVGFEMTEQEKALLNSLSKPMFAAEDGAGLSTETPSDCSFGS